MELRMTQYIKQSMVSLLLLGVLVSIFGAFAFSKSASAQTAQDQILTGIDQACSGGGCAADEGNLQDTVTAVINILSVVVGVVAVVMVVVGGLKYVASQGDSSGIASAKNTIVYALVGIVIVALSQVIVRFVVQRSTDTTPAPASTSEAAPQNPTGDIQDCANGADLC